ncbi:aspartate/glutamate racemase family protein [Streptomyces sp. NBC_00154]|uniref:aspartate/glutamate racemase family protein n=1 Tax=Streptomyces sp. NBC_00154 TaxID=2975670 RepID=UPI00225B01F7|nr:amino acid racemase [Streptomyces sp. NBC_00154]MCX5316096.1 amino acid racemase [Streptomyces sp. NBC_00154]
MSEHTVLKIGLVGGLSFPSTITYYDRINRAVNRRLGKAHSPRIVLESLDFQPMVEWIAARDGHAVAGEIAAAARRLEQSGADFFAICCNTVHEYADLVEESVALPLINICRVTAEETARRRVSTVGLLGSAFSMEQAFYRDEFAAQGIKVVTPEPDDRAFMQDSIERELCTGDISQATRDRFLRIAHDLLASGAEALVLACTEVPLVIRAEDIPAPVIDTVDVHTAAIVRRALGPLGGGV